MSAVIKAQAAAEWQQRNAAAHMADEDKPATTDESHGRLLKIPASKIPPNLVFHPGCHVVCMDYEVGTPPVVLYGIVQYAAVNLDTMDYVYCIQSKPYGEPYLATEKTLQFAQAMPVWAKLPGVPGYSEALVFSSQQAHPDATPVYAVTQTAEQGYHTNIPAKHIKYRGPGSVKPIDTEPPKPVSAPKTQVVAKDDDDFFLLGCNPFNCGPKSESGPVPSPKKEANGPAAASE